MHDTNPQRSDPTEAFNTEIINKLIEKYRVSIQQGEKPSLDELCQEFPQYREVIASKLAALQTALIAANPDSEDRGDGEILKLTSQLSHLRFLAKGGLGSVYIANDGALHRDVAVKFIHEALTRDPESLLRFSIEAEVTGRLEHPGVVPLYGIGRGEDGKPFYVMRLIEGQTMDQSIADYEELEKRTEQEPRGFAFRQLLNQFVSVCKTIAYAHNRGIVHRDIKPANIMLGRYGETIVVDWGLAVSVLRSEPFRQSGERTLHVKAIGESGNSTASGTGTPAYMSPEQHSGLDATPSSDIYSLGVTLYKILTGRTPYKDIDLSEIRQRILSGNVPLPSTLNRCSRPLEAICMKAISVHPQDRYETALAMAEEVERYLADDRVQAFREPFGMRVARWARRNRTPVQVGIVAVCAVAIITLISSIWMAQLAGQEREARELAQVSEALSEAARRENLQSSARFLAERIAYEIDLRWRILEAEAQSPVLKQMMLEQTARAETPDSLQSWLNERKLAKGQSIANSGWSLFGADGTQVARAPKHRSIGRSYRHRDYFHGKGVDLDPDDTTLTEIKPMAYVRQRVAADEDVVHMSVVFESTNTGNLVVAFSVPIWDKPIDEVDRSVIGVFSMPLEIHEFNLPRTAMLFQIDEDQIAGQPGLVIAHPLLGRRSEEDLPPRVDTTTMMLADDLRKLKLRGNISTTEADEILIDFVDPVSNKVGLAAVAPVIVRGRPTVIGDTHWAVIVQERATTK